MTAAIDTDWLKTPLGSYMLLRERHYFDRAVADVFGFNAAQIGLPGVDMLRNSRIPLRVRLGRGPAPLLPAEPTLLPIACRSLDLVVLPHALEFSNHPHQVLREVERVLRPDGRVVISGFNPYSLWGMTRRFKGGVEADFPWSGSFLALPRIKDWLALLGFELAAGSMCCYRPPLNDQKWLRRFRFMEPAGDRWWAMGGGVYFLQAIKRVQGMRVITPAWREPVKRHAALAPAARKIVNLQQYRVRRDKSR
jgi:SAM-dependent methyltransferase